MPFFALKIPLPRITKLLTLRHNNKSSNCPSMDNDEAEVAVTSHML